MGIFDIFTYQQQVKESILPLAAKQEILSGNLPQINTNSIFLKSNEKCVFVDKAILNDHVLKKIYRHTGGSAPGLIKGHRINYGRGKAKEYEEIKQYKGLLYITTRRVIFQAQGKSFDKSHNYLSSIDTYSNAVVLQYGEKSFELIVPDGIVVNAALRLVN